MTLILGPELIAGGTVSKGDVIVGDIVEEMNLALVKKKSGRDRMDGSVPPSFVEEAPFMIQMFEEVHVCRRTKPVEIGNLEIGPLGPPRRLARKM